ncbi:hypothetical protein MRB53_038408 [Persea americana]|nr:hypothetical protein MRB53_038408 [Persea americana]
MTLNQQLHRASAYDNEVGCWLHPRSSTLLDQENGGVALGEGDQYSPDNIRSLGVVGAINGPSIVGDCTVVYVIGVACCLVPAANGSRLVRRMSRADWLNPSNREWAGQNGQRKDSTNECEDQTGVNMPDRDPMSTERRCSVVVEANGCRVEVGRVKSTLTGKVGWLELGGVTDQPPAAALFADGKGRA